MPILDDCQMKIDDWEYCYCKKCDNIRYKSELRATDEGAQCAVCNTFDLEPPAWVRCPSEMRGTAVKCPRGGKGIIAMPEGEECLFHCSFRAAG